MRNQVMRHPLAAFVALACAISWISWAFMWLYDTGAVNGLYIVGATGPALAAMIVSATLEPESSGASTAKRWRSFGLVWIVALACLALRRFWVTLDLTSIALRAATTAVYPSLTAFLLDALGAAAVAFVLTGTLSPRQGVRHLLQSLGPRGQSARWYWLVFAVGLYPGIMALGNLLSASVGLGAAEPRASGPWSWLALDVVFTFWHVLLFGGGLEEPGWRGFALPCLLRRYSPLRSSLVLAVIWAFWHWPIFWFGFYGGGPYGVFGFVLRVAPLAVLLTAVFNLSGGSLLVAALLHTSFNITPVYLPASTLAVSLWMLLIGGVAICMWRCPRAFSPHSASTGEESGARNAGSTPPTPTRTPFA